MREPSQETGTSRTRPNRLRNEIVGGALIVTFTLLVLFAGFTYWMGKEILLSNALQSLEAVAAVQEARVEAYAGLGVTDFELVAERPILISALEELNRTGDDTHIQDIRRVVEAAEEAAADVEHIFVFGADLRLVVGPEEAGAGIDVPAAYLRSAADGIVSGLVTTTDGGTVVHLVAGPIVSDDQPVGVAVVAQSTQALVELANDTSGLGQTGETVLAQSWSGEPSFIAPLRFYGDAALKPVPAHLEGLPVASALDGAEGVTSRGVDYRGESVVAVTRFVDGPAWGLVVKMDRREVLMPLDEYVLVVMGVLSVGLVGAYFLAARSAEWILEPVRRLTSTAKTIAAGRRDLRAVSDRDDEIGELATAFNEMTRQLNSLTAGLEVRVAERTRELRRKNAQLARIMEEKETFLAGVSHEVRSPLTAMIGFLDLVNEAGDSLSDDERAEMLETVSRQADDVLNLIEDLLASARVEAGTLKVVSVRCDLAAQARQVIECVAPNLRIDIDLQGDGACALADPARVRQIIRNLLSNADRYGGSNVEVRIARSDGEAVMEVRDDGPGVPEEDRDAIFAAYGQSIAGRRVEGSVGLGLHVSRELARLMGGDLTYEHVDGWSVFSLTLPEHTDEPDSEVQAATVAAATA